MEIIKSFRDMHPLLRALAERVKASGKPLLLAEMVGWVADQRTNRRQRMSLHQSVAHFWGKPIIPDDPNACWVVRNKTGKYGITKFRFIPNETSNHRLAFLMAVGPIPGSLWVLHRCDNRPCINPDHLFLGTASDNMQDMISKGRHIKPTGARN